MAERLLGRKQTGIDAGAKLHASVDEQQHPTERTSAQFIQKATHAHDLFGKRFTSGRPHVQPIVEPALQLRIVDLVEPAHLPSPEIQLQQPGIALCIAVSACFGQTDATAQRAAPRSVESGARQGLPNDSRLLVEGRPQRDIRPPVTRPRRNIDRRMPNQPDLHD